MSDIWIKQTTGTSSTTWKKAVNLFVKTTTGTTSAAWKAATAVYVYFSSGWTRVWPLSGVFKITSPYITTSSGSTTPLYGVDGARRVGSVVWGKNGTWNANGWVINSYQYRWRAYNSSDINDTNIGSQTALATYSSAVSLTIPATYDRKYLSFFIQANSSGGAAYNGFAESGTEYGGLQIVRQQPINISASLSNLAPQVGNTISFSSSWNTTDAYAPEAGRTTIQWYKNLSNSTTGGTLRSSGSYSFLVEQEDLNHYIYAVETTFNSGTDYDLGINTGVLVSRITTSVVSPALTAPTSTSIVSVSRLNNTQARVIVSSSGGSGPYYQLYWTSSSTAPTTASYDAASTTSTVTEDFGFSSGTTYYFYVRSSSENLGNTTVSGTATAGTFSAYGPTTGAASYTFASPTGGTASISGSTSIGSTLTLSLESPSASPAADGLTIIWRIANGGTGGNSFTGGTILQNGGTTLVIPSTAAGIGTVGYAIRAEVTWNNGVGSQSANSNSIVVTAAAVAPSNTSIPTLSPTSLSVGTQLTAGVGTWSGTTPISYDLRIYRGTAGVLTSETLVASTTTTSSATTLNYTITQTDYDSGQRYFRTYVNATNSAGSSGFIGGQERGPIATPVIAPSGGSVSISTNTGNYSVGSIITYSTSGWANSPTSYYLELHNGTNPVLTSDPLRASTTSTSGTYTITSSDVPNYFKAWATATNSAGSTQAASAQVGPAYTPVSIPSGGSVTLSGNSTAGSTITASTSGWSGSPTSYDVYITTALSPNIPTSSSTRVSSSGGGSSTSYTITSSDAISPVNIFRAFATASNSAGTSGTVQSSNTITTTASGGGSAPATPTGVSTSGSGLVTWNASTGATSYTVGYQLATSASGTQTLPATTETVTGTSYQITYQTVGGTLYNYARARVLATNSSGSSAYSGYSPATGYV